MTSPSGAGIRRDAPDRRTRRPRADRRERAGRRRPAGAGRRDGRRRRPGVPHRSAELQEPEAAAGRRRTPAERRHGRSSTRPTCSTWRRPTTGSASPAGSCSAEHAQAAAAIGARGMVVHGGHVLAEDDPAVGVDNWRKTFTYQAEERRLPAPAAHREHGRRRQRDGAGARRDRTAVGGDRRVRRRVRPRHLPRLGGRLGPRRPPSTTSARSPGGWTSCTSTTAATRTARAATGTPR